MTVKTFYSHFVNCKMFYSFFDIDDNYDNNDNNTLFLEHQISILKLFLKTCKTGEMTDENSFVVTGINIHIYKYTNKYIF